MESRWSDIAAKECVESFPDVDEALALRVYSSRLIGAEPELVLHGGGNTSHKARATDLFGDTVDVLHIKGSGWDLATIAPAGLPAVALAPLLRLRTLDALSDEMMMAELRRALLDPAAPNPSVETLLHAFLPHRVIDHSHADAILALTNQADGRERVRALYGDRVAWVPYVMPGLALAKRAAEIFEKSPGVEGLVLEKHGLFTFGDDARQSYERHVQIVAEARAHIDDAMQGRRMLDARPVIAMREPHEVAPVLRGALAEPLSSEDRPFRHFVLEHRVSDEILHFAAAGPRTARLCEAPPITPDHVIRTKGAYLFVEHPPYGDLAALREALRGAVESYRASYRAYFERNARGRALVALDPTPRVVVLPGVGLFAVGETQRAARIAADIAEHTVRTKIWAETIGEYRGLDEADLFDMEYWSLEQAKLGRAAAPPLLGRVALITGAGGAIGAGIARVFAAAGAHVVLVDIDGDALERTCSALGSAPATAVVADVSDDDAMEVAFAAGAAAYGGVDIVVANAGVACAGALEALHLEDFDRAVNVNLRGTFVTLREGLRHFRLQGIGGDIVVLSTKNVFAPGAEFGAYSASKAGAHQLGRIAALEGAALGVRVNMINADAVFGSAAHPSGLWRDVGPARAQARGLEVDALPEFYRSRNLLKAQVTAEHVGRAALFFVTRQTPTTGAALPVDGGLPEAFPR
jgi:rhamnulose-1-phosphate aldolase/alcohol dehydrogenase